VAEVAVRAARPRDAPVLAAVQVRAWPWLSLPPAEVAERWREGISNPPSGRHRVVVATSGERVVGFAAFGPALDEDRDPASIAEIYLLLVDPAARRAGHGSRLLAAVVDRLRAEGVTGAVAWVEPEAAGFAEAAGWGPDGSRREVTIETGPVGQVRLHTDLR
jgi:GNAT superfamily N-acetyltransferase